MKIDAGKILAIAAGLAGIASTLLTNEVKKQQEKETKEAWKAEVLAELTKTKES